MKNLKISFTKGLLIIAIFACAFSFIAIKVIEKISDITCSYDISCTDYNRQIKSIIFFIC